MNTPFLEVLIPEQPIAWKRPGFAKASPGCARPNGHRYDSQAALKEKHGWFFKEAMTRLRSQGASPGFVRPSEKPLIIHLIFNFIRVKSNKRKHHTSDPDIDNCCKYYLDAMQDVVYLNDNQVVELSAKKNYSVVPSVSITIFEV